jgi:predicted transcriptional regulator
MKDIMSKAGIRQTEAALLLQVSRATLNRWYEGKTTKQKTVADRVNKILELVAKATLAGHLPVQDVVGKSRFKAIIAALKSVA